MAQYFKAVNVTKQEFFCSQCLGGDYKFWGWATDPQGALFTLLLRKSDDRGSGGDICDTTFETDTNAIIGRWAGDHVVLLGDLDSSDLYRESKSFRNISRELAEVWNRFMPHEDKKLTFQDYCLCQRIWD